MNIIEPVFGSNPVPFDLIEHVCASNHPHEISSDLVCHMLWKTFVKTPLRVS
jgi:hypothetical protein